MAFRPGPVELQASAHELSLVRLADDGLEAAMVMAQTRSRRAVESQAETPPTKPPVPRSARAIHAREALWSMNRETHSAPPC